MEPGERRKRKENDRASVILENTTSVKVKEIKIYIENY
jgi:hypothetical protein